MEKNTETLIAATEAANPWAATGDTAAPATVTTATEAASPWGAAEPAASPWGAAEPAAAATDSWLSEPAAAATDATGFQIAQLWDGSLPIQSWINDGLAWTVDNFRPFFQAVRAPIDATLGGVEALLLSVPTLAMIALLGLIAWQCAGRAIAIGGVISLLLVAVLGIWPEAMVTLSLVMTSLVFCLLIGLPMGIALAASDRANRIMRPVLDAMQTTPAFVYLVPVVMLFGIGNVPGVIVTIVFALPPLVRLTTLGISQVRPDLIEAARSYGASPMQLLTKVQLPLAMPSIMAGINQTLMLSLSMVVIASMIAVGGLGQMVLRGIGRLDMGLATVGGLGIVLLAITLDRITQAMGQPSRGARHWWQTGPSGLVLRLLRLLRTAKSKTSAAPARPAAQTVAAKPAAAASAATGAEPQGA
jgi:glycine betaine/proline transport system permease protein